MEIKRNGSQASGKGSAEYLTGNARIDALFEAPEPARTLADEQYPARKAHS